MNQIHKLKLDHPFSIGGKAVTEVAIRRPKVKDIREIDKVKDQGDLQQGLQMASLLTGLPVEALDEMDAADFTRVSELVMSFLDRSKAPDTGAR